MTPKELKPAFARMITLWGMPRGVRPDHDTNNNHLPAASELFDEYLHSLEKYPAQHLNAAIDHLADDPNNKFFPNLHTLKNTIESLFPKQTSHSELEARFKSDEAAFLAKLNSAKSWLRSQHNKNQILEDCETAARSLCNNLDFLWNIPQIREAALRNALIATWKQNTNPERNE